MHNDAHVESRVNTSTGGMISGSHGGPMVVITEPLADLLVPRPQVGHARSFTLSGAIPCAMSIIKLPVGSCQVSPTV